MLRNTTTPTTKRSRRARRVVGGLFGAAVLASLSAVAAPSASAADVPDGIVWDHVYKAPGVTVYVEEYGDIISVCDSAANGAPAIASITDMTKVRSYTIKVTNGYGSCVTRGAGDGGVYNLTEGATIEVAYRGSGSVFLWDRYLNDH